MITRTIGTAIEPMRSAYREQDACGMISPKMTMTMVEVRKPISPDVISAMMIESSEFTPTLPSSSVHSSKFPFSRTGAIRCTSAARAAGWSERGSARALGRGGRRSAPVQTVSASRPRRP